MTQREIEIRTRVRGCALALHAVLDEEFALRLGRLQRAEKRMVEAAVGFDKSGTSVTQDALWKAAKRLTTAVRKYHHSNTPRLMRTDGQPWDPREDR